MYEIPEAVVVSEQLNNTVKGKRIIRAVAGTSPHKFAWYFGEPSDYDSLLSGHTLGNTYPYGGRVEIEAGDISLHFGDGAILRFYGADEQLPAKHQLFISFEDGSSLIATVAMYGGLWVFPVGAMDDNFYYRVAKEAVSPLSDAFDYEYFLRLFDEQSQKMSAKAFLATQQRIPGLGNGVLQDILLNARIHPKRKINSLQKQQWRELFDSMKTTLAEMAENGGRDTERDLFGQPGGYKTKLSKNTLPLICPNCGGTVKKEAYLGGSVYYCEQCQKL